MQYRDGTDSWPGVILLVVSANLVSRKVRERVVIEFYISIKFRDHKEETSKEKEALMESFGILGSIYKIFLESKGSIFMI